MSYDYNKFQKLCEIKGVNPNMVAKATGITKSTFTEWKKGTYTPKTEKIRKLAEYFEVNELDFSDKDNSTPKFQEVQMLGDNIRKLRELRGLTQEELAKKLNVSRTTMSSWEINRTEPSSGQITQMSKILGCSVSMFFGEEELPEPEVKLKKEEIAEARLRIIGEMLNAPDDVIISILTILDKFPKHSKKDNTISEQ